MNQWKNLNELTSYQHLGQNERVDLTLAMAGEEGTARVKKYNAPMAAGMTYYYAAKQVDDAILKDLCALAEEAQLASKFEELYNGAVINTGEKRLVLHHLTRGQLGSAVNADGTDKRTFYTEQQHKIASFAKRCMTERLSMTRAKPSPLWFRSASAEATWVPAPCTWHWKTGPRPTAASG